MPEIESMEDIAARVREAKSPAALMPNLSGGDQFETFSVPETEIGGVRTFSFEMAAQEAATLAKLKAQNRVDKVRVAGDSLILECTILGELEGEAFEIPTVMIVTLKEAKVVRMIMVQQSDHPAMKAMRESAVA